MRAFAWSFGKDRGCGQRVLDHVSQLAARSGVWSPPAGTALVAMMMVDAGSADAGSRLAVSAAARIRLTVIYRIIQQALTDATRYCHGTRAVIENPENATTVGLGVRDDGDGFHPASTADSA